MVHVQRFKRGRLNKHRNPNFMWGCVILSESRIPGIIGLHGFKNYKMLRYQEITEKIIGASFEVHKFLGNGFQEVIYQRALAWELDQKGLQFNREIEQEIFYKDLPNPIGTRRADFVVENKVLT